MLDDGGIGEIAGDGPHARVVESRRGCHVEQYHFANRALGAACVGQAVAREERAGEAGAEEAGAAGDHDAHGELLEWRRAMMRQIGARAKSHESAR